MSDPDVDGAFLRNAVLDCIVPSASDADIGDILNTPSDDGDPESLLPTVAQRSVIYFDETVTVYTILRVTNCPEATLKAHLPRLNLKVEGFAINGQTYDGPDGPQAANSREQIFTGPVEDQDDPLIIVNEPESEDQEEQDGESTNPSQTSEEDGKTCLVMWKAKAPISRPRLRLNQPAIIFVASASIKPVEEDTTKDIVKDEYLPSLIPASVNLLAPLQDDPAFTKTKPHLPASRLSRVIPVTQTEDPLYRIRNKSSRAFRVVPAVSARVRYSRMNTYSSRPTTVASLDFEVTPYVTSSVILEKVSLDLSDGQVLPLMEAVGLQTPVTCRPRDDITFLYKLIPNINPETDNQTTVIVGTLDISMTARISISPLCNPSITMSWRTNVDFSTPLNPTYGAPSHFLQRNNRPASLPIGGNGTPTNGAQTPNRQSVRERGLSGAADMGITVSFSGPSTVDVGRVFPWSVFVVNHSTKTKKLAIVAIPHRRRRGSASEGAKGHVARPSTGSNRGGGAGKGTPVEDVAEAVTDENVVYALQKSAVINDANLICVSADMRVGPLLPGSCHAVELKFLPLVAGPLLLDAVRLIDMNTNEVMDVRDLPDIVAVD